MSTKFLALLLAVNFAFPTSSYAVHPAVVAVIVEAGRQLSDMSNRGDIKIVLLSHAHCGRSPHDGENRGARLGRYYEELLEAGASGDPDLIYERAIRLQETVNKSSMYQDCFRAMGDAAKVMGMVNQIVAAQQSGGPSR
jgi:sirohydrochlorin ferrochelatase